MSVACLALRAMRERPAVAAAAVLLLVLLFLQRDVRAELIDRVAAAVNNEVITLSELRQAVEFNAALGGRGDGRRVEAETLEGIINRRLLLLEAYRLRIAEVTDQEVAAEVGRLRQRLGTDASFREFLARTGLTEAQLEQILGERLLVERFVEKKIGLFARVSRDDAASYYAGHVQEFGGRRFPEVQRQITALLNEQMLNQQLDQYINELRARANIRINPLREEGE